VGVGVGVRVGVWRGTGVGVSVAVAVGGAVSVWLGVGVTVAVGTEVGVRVGLGVAEGLAVGVPLEFRVASTKGVGLGSQATNDEPQAARTLPTVVSPTIRKKSRRVSSRSWPGKLIGYKCFLVWRPGDGDQPFAVTAELVELMRAIDGFDLKARMPQKQL
jgi:hypothetical protein